MSNDDIRSLLGVQICQALQMDTSKIIRLEIVMEAGEIPVVHVTRALFGHDCGGPLTKLLEQYQLTPLASEVQAADADPAAPSPVCPCGGVSFAPCSWLSENFVRMTCFRCGLSGRINPDSGLLVAVVPHPASVRISEPTRSTDRPAEGLQR